MMEQALEANGISGASSLMCTSFKTVVMFMLFYEGNVVKEGRSKSMNQGLTEFQHLVTDH